MKKTNKVANTYKKENYKEKTDNFSERLLKKQGEKGFNDKEIYESIGVSKTTFDNWKNKTKTPSVLALLALSYKLDISIDYLLSKTELSSFENDKISEITGLSDATINVLKHDVKLYDKDTSEAINIILNSPHGKVLLNDIYLYLCSQNTEGYTVLKGDNIPDNLIDTPVSLEALYLNQIQADLIDTKGNLSQDRPKKKSSKGKRSSKP